MVARFGIIQIFHAKVSGKIFNQIFGRNFQSNFREKFSIKFFVGLDRDAGSSKLARFGIIKGSATRDRERRRTEADNQQQRVGVDIGSSR